MGALLSLFEQAPRPKPTGKPRHYQDTAVTQALATVGNPETRRGLVVMPTGTGKTAVAAEMARRFPGRILFLAEQRQILRQAARKFAEWLGIHVDEIGLEQADNYSRGERIVCGMRQTLANPLRLEGLDRRGGPPGLIIVDEGHHHAGKTNAQYTRILERYPQAMVVGLTATPDRGDGTALEKAWERVLYRLEIHEAVSDGWLVPVETATIGDYEPLDLSKIKRVAGELDDAAIEAMIAGIVREQAKATAERCEKLKSIVFCGRVETAHLLAEALDAEMGRKCARAVDGSMDDDEKDAVLDAFKASEFQFLVNVGICIEGFDAPDAVAAVLTRPFLSRGGFTQRCGRVLRPLAPGLDACATAEERRAHIAASAKPTALLVNFKFLPGRHTLVCPEDILAGSDVDEEEKERAKKLREEGKAKTVDESLALAKELARQERERKAEAVRRAQAQHQVEWGSFDPFGAFGIEAPVSMDGPRASSSLMRSLRDMGLPVPRGCTQEQAMKLMRTMKARQRAGLAVLGQIQFLQRHGVTDAHRWSFKRAADEMRRIQHEQRGWRKP